MTKPISDELRRKGYFDWAEAARYCGLDYAYFRGLVQRQRGPLRTRPSRNLSLFHIDDLDEWIAAWKTPVEPSFTGASQQQGHTKDQPPEDQRLT